MVKFIVISKDSEQELNSLADAMAYARTLNEFVTIKNSEFEIVGMFGVDSIKEGMCPDGVEYTWRKRR